MTLRAIHLTVPPAGELELAMYSHQHFLRNFKSGACFCLPYLQFINGFRLYHNMYRTLMGIYTTLSGMSYQDHNRRLNIFVITLSPHGCSFEDLISSLIALQELDEGLTLSINGHNAFVCVFTQAYVSDMPQQTENSGFKQFNVKCGCGKCIVTQ